MTVRASEFDALAAKVDAGELTENEVVSWMASAGWPGHTVLECWAWWETEYASRRGRAGVPGGSARAGSRNDSGGEPPGTLPGVQDPAPCAVTAEELQ